MNIQLSLLVAVTVFLGAGCASTHGERSAFDPIRLPCLGRAVCGLDDILGPRQLPG